MKLSAYESLSTSRETAIDVELKTQGQSDNLYWHALRKTRITASKFGLITKRVRDFDKLLKQLNPTRRVVTAPMRRGIEMEPRAAEVYANAAKNGQVNIYPSGLVINPKCPCLACSPDRKIYDPGSDDKWGLLEIKVVQEGQSSFEKVHCLEFNSEKAVLSLKKNHIYHYRVQCQLGLTGLNWCDFFCYIEYSTYFCERILFDSQFFQDSKDKVDLFYFIIKVYAFKSQLIVVLKE